MDTMKAWQYTSASGGLEKNLYLPAAGTPKPTIKDDQILVEVYSMAINPADYKVPELGFVATAFISKPASPGVDFCGRVAALGSKVDNLKLDEMVFGALPRPCKYGSLSQYIIVAKDGCVALPDGVDIDHAASIGVAGLTAYQSIKPHIKEGDKVFINGGSGGTGIYAIQIAKILGCHVTTSCSTANIELCKKLGADEVLDYKSGDIIKMLQQKGQIFSLVVDNIGTPSNLYKVSSSFLLPTGKFVQVGAGVSLGAISQLASNMLLPGFLGGGKRKYQLFIVNWNSDDARQLGAWMQEKRLEAIIDSVFQYDEAPKAFEKLKTGRAKGKIVVKVKKGE